MSAKGCAGCKEERDGKDVSSAGRMLWPVIISGLNMPISVAICLKDPLHRQITKIKNNLVIRIYDSRV